MTRLLLLVFVTALSMTAGSTTVHAQAPAGSTQVTWIRANAVYASKRYGDGDNVDDYTWWFWYDGVLERADHRCITLDWDFNKHKDPPGWSSLTSVSIAVPRINDPYTELQVVGMEAYEDDAGNRCDYNTKDDGDDGPCDQRFGFYYGNYPPAVTNRETIFCNDWGLQFEFRYNLPTPLKPTELTPAPGNICSTGPIRLTSQNYVNPVFANDPRYKYELEWQYTTDNPNADWPWITFSTTPAYFDFSTPYPRAEADFPTNLFSNITVNTDFYYRVRSRMTLLIGNGIEGAGWSFLSEPSAFNVLHISPQPPSFTIGVNTPSCPNPENINGKLSVNVTGRGDYLYSLAGTNSGPCDPLNQDCGGHSSHFQASTLDIAAIAPGDYYLRISNYPGADGTHGVCATVQQVTVGALPLLQTQPPGITPVSCPGGTDGAIQVKYAGGIEPWTYHLSKTGYDADSDDGTFAALPTGSYTSTVTDGCQQTVAAPVTVPEPLRITAETAPLSPTCTAPFNGSVKVDITQGEGTYSFKILRNGETVESLDAATVNTWTAQSLTDGAFTVEIRDAQRLQCDATTLPVINLELPKDIKLLPGDITQKNLTCFEQNDGYIQLSNVDLGGTFKYTIAGQTTGTQRALTTTALFDNLPADSYHVVALRNVDGCTDAVDIPTPVVVTQPEKIVITLNKADVKCFDDGNGGITPIVAGGSDSDQYLWETFLDGDWATFTAGPTTLDHLSPGTYRLRITNASNCQGQSEEVTVGQPDALTIVDLDLQDMTCFEGTGEIKATVQGGVFPYIYRYETTGGTTELTASTAHLPEGNYAFSVTDANGCLTSSARELIITSPSEPLSLTYILSQFNGYNVSCHGASNGFVDMTAAGGNGVGYTGYEYALNDRPYQTVARFENMSPGPHTLFVRDARGCAVSKYVTFLEPASDLQTRLLAKENVKCLNDETGKLSLETTGGTAPYRFTLNNTVTQDAGIFTDLPAGDYTILIADKNGCSTEYDAEITILNTPIVISLQTTDVSCHDGTNGTIVAGVTGGVGALQQKWTSGLTPVSNITHLPAGEYTLTVTDAVGCVLQESATLTQPDAIATKTTVIPVCVGKETGEIWLETSGGTRAYRYSTDGGHVYQEVPVFKNLPAGTYDVHIQDAHSCEISFASEVTVRNDLPKPNFLVASNENALDTLVINEISVPMADSVEWTFDPAIQVINPDARAPQILVNEPGNYTIAMTGYFGGCDYTSTVTITINPYNPEENIKIAAPYETIQTMTATPNPTDGEFDVAIELNAKQDLALTVIDFLGVEHYNETWRKTKSVSKKINIKNEQLAPGIYIVRVVTDTDAREVRILINR